METEPSYAAQEGRLLETILAHAADRPEAMALSCEERALTWGQLRETVLRLAGAIDAQSLEPLKRPIALLGQTGIQLVVTYLAIIAAGRCAVPLPISASSETVLGMIDDCDPELLFLDAAGAKLIGERPIDSTIGIGLSKDATISWERFLTSGVSLWQPRAMAPGDDFNIIYSSGTTAKPKGIVHPHAMRYRQAMRSTFGLSPASKMVLATPLYSNTTLMPLLATLAHGGQVVLMRKFSSTGYLRLAEAVRATHTMLVPIQYQRILAERAFGTFDLSSFVLKQSTGAALAPAIKRDALARWPGKLLEVYGLTEGGCTCILDVGAHPGRMHTVGTPAAGNDIRFIDDLGNLLPAGDVGEIVGRSPTMMTGYFHNETATQALYWRDEDGNLFHRTGDIGQFDDAGFLVLRDRKKDVIISGGFNIFASDLESVLLDHPDVAEVAVIAVPSEVWGETPLALVVPKPATSPDATDLCNWANERVGKMQRLNGVEIRSALPRSAAGKVLKQELKSPYWP